MIFLYIVSGFILLITFFISLKIIKMVTGRKRASEELSAMKLEKISNPGTVKNLTILPLIDYYSDKDDFLTEEGVSYLIKADDRTILFDVGLNKKKEHPSPLLKNMDRLGVEMEDVDMIFISHVHNDHVGGFKSPPMS